MVQNKKLALFFLFFTLSYLVGLILFMPEGRLTSWVRLSIPNTVVWQHLEWHWWGFEGSRVSVQHPDLSSRLTIQKIEIIPNPLSLLRGSPSVDFVVHHANSRIQGTMVWSDPLSTLHWTMNLQDFTLFESFFPLSKSVSGSATGSGELQLDLVANTLVAIQWSLQGNHLSVAGVVLDHATLTGETKEKGGLRQLLVNLSGKGNIAVSGQGVVRLQNEHLGKSVLSGRVRIQPLTNRLSGWVGGFLAGKPATVQLAGHLNRPTWKIE